MSDYFVHESSYVDDGAEIGAGTKIWHFAILCRERILASVAVSVRTYLFRLM